MNYVLAISGGVDSVVLLDMAIKGSLGLEGKLIVAHVSHGIRDDSDDDERFVCGLASRYGLEYCATHLELGRDASEQMARQKRYEFLFAKANELDATIVTAHHLDDVVETVAINLARGTGWRGVAVMARKGIERPLLRMTKQEIYEYALMHRLEWVEDSTNATDQYLRNRLRRQTHGLSRETKSRLFMLRDSQLELAESVAHEVERLRHTDTSRYFYVMIDESSADELLRSCLTRHSITPPARPQRRRAIHAIRVFRAGTTYPVADGVSLQFSARNFIVITSEK